MKNINKNNRSVKGIIACLFHAIINVILAIIKFHVGLIFVSMTVLADGFNNLGDSISGFANAFAFFKTRKKENYKFPYGYGKIEYIFSLLTALIVILIGGIFIKFLAEKAVVGNVKGGFNYIWGSVLIASVFVKIIMAVFYYLINKKVNSPIIKIICLDSIQDTFISAVTVFTFYWSGISKIQIDVFIGFVIGVYLILQSILLMFVLSRKLLGGTQRTNEVHLSLIELLKQKNEAYFIENLNIHDYGPNKLLITLNAYFKKIIEPKQIKQEKLDCENILRKRNIESNISLIFEDISEIEKNKIKNIQISVLNNFEFIKFNIIKDKLTLIIPAKYVNIEEHIKWIIYTQTMHKIEEDYNILYENY